MSSGWKAVPIPLEATLAKSHGQVKWASEMSRVALVYPVQLLGCRLWPIHRGGCCGRRMRTGRMRTLTFNQRSNPQRTWPIVGGDLKRRTRTKTCINMWTLT